MTRKNSDPFITISIVLLFFIVIILNASGALSLTIKNVSPFYILPFFVAFSVFSTTGKSAIAGFLVGACIDSVAMDSYCFNTLLFIFLGVAVCLCANNLFNKNFPATVLLSFISSALYFSLNWFFFHISNTDIQQSLQYLFKISLPSTIYTSLFIFPFYFIFKYLNNLKNQ